MKHLDKRKTSLSVENRVDIAQTEQQGDHHHEPNDPIQQHASSNNPGYVDSSIGDLLSQMNAGIGTDKRRDITHEPDAVRQTLRGPSALVHARREDKFRRMARGEAPEHGDDGYKPGNVEDDSTDLDTRQGSGDDDIKENRHQHNQPGQQGTLPALGGVIWVVDDKQTLQHGTSEHTLGSHSRDPRKRRQPANDVAHEHTSTRGSHNVRPVVLAGSDGRHGSQLRDDRVHGQGGAPSDDEAVDKTARATIFEALVKQGQDRLPGDEFADGKTEQGPETEATGEDLFLSETGQFLVIGDVGRSTVHATGKLTDGR